MAMTGGTIVAGGDPVFVGKVGDSKVVVTPSGVVFDRDAGYYDAPNAKVDIGGTAEAVSYTHLVTEPSRLADRTCVT